MTPKEKPAGAHRGLRIAPIAAAAVLAVCLIGFFVYVGNYYHADDIGKSAASDTGLYADDGVTVKSIDDGDLAFVPHDPFAGLVFYPGGKVEAEAYAPLMQRLAKEGMLCVICKMPFNLAVFDINAADGVKEQFPKVDEWFIGGHSLGGSMAASYLDSHPGSFAGLVLLGAYSTVDLSDDDAKVLSIYGSNDGVMNRDNYAQNAGNAPGAEEDVVEGGNHAQFGSYGTQSGDGEAAITPEAQWNETAQLIVDWIKS